MQKTKKAFTLVEILIYTGILGITASILTGVLFNATKIKSRQTATIEVNNQLNFALQTIQRSIADSSIIDITSGVSTSSLALRFQDEAKNPTIFYVSNGILYKKEGTGEPQPITNNTVAVNAANFLKISGYSGHDSVQMDLTISYNTQNPDSYFSKTLSSAVARVSAATFDSNLIPGSDNFYDLGISSTKWKDMYLSGSMYLTEAGSKIGIGTASPTRKLEIAQGVFTNGNNTTNGVLISGDATGNPGYLGTRYALNNTSGNYAGFVRAVRTSGTTFIGMEIGSETNHGIRFLTNGTADSAEKMRITNTGNVGIGVAAPITPLQVNGAYTAASTGTTPNGNIWLGAAGTTVGLSLGVDAGSGSGYPTYIQSRDNGSASFFSLLLNPNGGNVGIGTTNPTQKLSVGAEGGNGLNIRLGAWASLGNTYSHGATILGNNTISNTATADGMTIMTTNESIGARAIRMEYDEGITFHTLSGSVTAGAAFSSERMRINNSGNVGIGTTNPAAKLDVNGALKILSMAEQSLGTNGYIKIGGVILQWGRVTGLFDTTVAVTFPIAFPTVCASMSAIQVGDVGADPYVNGFKVTTGPTTTGFSVTARDNGTNDWYWMAVGY